MNRVFLFGISFNKGQATVLWDPATDRLGCPELGGLDI